MGLRTFSTFIALLFLWISLPTITHASEVGSAHQEIARKRVELAWELMLPAIYNCLLQHIECQLTQQEGDTLLKIFSARLKAKDLLNFKSGKDNPQMFDLSSGSHRLAATTRTANAPIYLNTDLIDPMGKDLRISSLLSILVHEFGHQLGFPDTEEHFLDQMGNKVARMLEQNIQRIEGEGSQHQDLEVLVFNQLSSPSKVRDWQDENIGTLPRIYITDGQRIVSVDESYPFLLNCPYGSTVRHAWLSDLHWKDTGVAAGKGVHYCLMGKDKMEIVESYFVNLDLVQDSSGNYRLGALPAQQMLPMSLFEITSDVSYENLLRMNKTPIILESVSGEATPQKLENGGTWNIDFLVKGDINLYEKCTLLISSDQFELTYATGQKYAFEAFNERCEMEPAGPGLFRIRAHYDFHKDTIQRNYFLKSIKLQPKDLIDTPMGLVMPNMRQEVSVGIKQQDKSLSITNVKLTSKGKMVQGPDYGFVENGLCKKFELSFDLPGNTEVVQAHLKYVLYYKNNMYSPIVLTDRLTRNFWHNWEVDSILKPQGGTTNNCTMALMPEFMEPENIDRIEFREITAQTAAMEEFKLIFPPGKFGLDTYFNFQPCD